MIIGGSIYRLWAACILSMYKEKLRKLKVVNPSKTSIDDIHQTHTRHTCMSKQGIDSIQVLLLVGICIWMYQGVFMCRFRCIPSPGITMTLTSWILLERLSGNSPQLLKRCGCRQPLAIHLRKAPEEKDGQSHLKRNSTHNQFCDENLWEQVIFYLFCNCKLEVFRNTPLENLLLLRINMKCIQFKLTKTKLQFKYRICLMILIIHIKFKALPVPDLDHGM